MTPGPSYTAQYAKAGALAPLDGYVDKYQWKDKFSPWALSLGVNDGKLYSLPSELETMVLWYNQSVFDKQGLAVPKTTADLVSTADKLQAAGVTPFGSGNGEWKGVNEWFVSALLNADAGPDAVYQALTGKKKFSDPEFVNAIKVLDDFQKKGQISGGLDRYYTLKFDQFLAEFAAGKYAMNMEGSWRFENIDKFFKAAGNEWDWAPFPTKDGTELYSIGIGSSWGINAKAQSPAAAADVLAHIFAPETQAKLAVDCGMAPGPVSLNAKMLTGLEPRKARLYEAISKAAKAGDYGYLTWTFWPPKSEQYIIEDIEKVWGGKTTPEQYLAGLDAIYTKELAAGGTPPIPQR
jgi:raffinose/stachyose/melibiose transport system substrate-binding protein